MSLQISGLTKRYATKTILENFSLTIPDKSFVSLLGPSGCGKTTLLRLIAGLESPNQGQIKLGENILADSRRFIAPEDRGFGMVFQSYAVWPHLNVFENVAYPLRVGRKWKGLAREDLDKKVTQALALVHLDSLASRMPNQLSGGQQQRVALARGLVMEPPVLLLDEPLSNLDARLRAEMRREIRDLHRKLKITMIYVTHDQREAFEMSTWVVVLNEGKIAQQGEPARVKAEPSSGFVEEFLREM